MNIEYHTGYAIEKSVDCVVNSANGFLLLGSSGAGRIRELSDKLNFWELVKYNIDLLRLPKDVRRYFLRVYKEHGWKVCKEQRNCVCLLLKNGGRSFMLGDVVVSPQKMDNKIIMHAVGMSYDITGEVTRIPATENSVRQCIESALRRAQKMKVKSIAIPVMCAKHAYGLNPNKSLEIIESVLQKYAHSSIAKVIICFDNKETEQYLNDVKNNTVQI